MSKNPYELKQTTLLEIENETLTQQVKQLKIKIKELENQIHIRELALAKYQDSTDKLLIELDKFLKN